MKKIILLMLALSACLQIACTNDYGKEVVEVPQTEETSIEVGSEDRIIINRSEDLSNYVVELFGIDDVATIIFNDTALVGVVTSYDNELTDDLKSLINDLVLEKDSEIKNVSISHDEKVFNEIVNIVNDLMNGKSYDNYVASISKMIEKTNKRN